MLLLLLRHLCLCVCVLQLVDELLAFWTLEDYETTLEELEEALITADFGPKTALKIVDQVRAAIKAGKVKTADDLRVQLKVCVSGGGQGEVWGEGGTGGGVGRVCRRLTGELPVRQGLWGLTGLLGTCTKYDKRSMSSRDRSSQNSTRTMDNA